jgi:aryl-alcohol dehydrogenase-like predicted oxidoreductase
MEQIRLGRSGGNWGPTDDPEAVTAIRRAADRGVTLFDTALAGPSPEQMPEVGQ